MDAGGSSSTDSGVRCGVSRMTGEAAIADDGAVPLCGVILPFVPFASRYTCFVVR